MLNEDPVVQYWGATGINGLAKMGFIESLPRIVETIMNNPNVIPEVKYMLAEAMVYVGNKQQGLNYLLQGLKESYKPAIAGLQNWETKPHL